MTQDKKSPQRATDDNPIGLDGELDIPLDTPAPMPSSTNYRDKKQGKFRPNFTDLHFTSSLYIDQAVENLRENALKANNERKDLLIIKSDVIQIDPDRARFELEAQRMGQTTYAMTGTMQRWQGSRTRVDAKIKKVSPHKAPFDIRQLLLFIVLLLISVVGVFVFAILFGRYPPIVFVGAYLMLITLLTFVHSKFQNPKKQLREDISPALTRLDIDELNTILVNTFTAHDIQWVQSGQHDDKQSKIHKFERSKSYLVREAGSTANFVAIEAVKMLHANGWLVGKNGALAGASLAGADLASANLQKANLESANLKHAELNGADLTEANLQAVILGYADLKNANLTEVNLKGANAVGANFEGADLESANLENMVLGYANLKGANLAGANLKGVELGIKVSVLALITRFDEYTVLPDADTTTKHKDSDGKWVYDKHWTPQTDMTRYTDPDHPDFWQPDWAKN